MWLVQRKKVFVAPLTGPLQAVWIWSVVGDTQGKGEICSADDDIGYAGLFQILQPLLRMEIGAG